MTGVFFSPFKHHLLCCLCTLRLLGQLHTAIFGRPRQKITIEEKRGDIFSLASKMSVLYHTGRRLKRWPIFLFLSISCSGVAASKDGTR